MGETSQPHLVFVFFIFFALIVATQTTGSVKCQTRSLRYPFGFSDGYPIRFNCSKITGDAVIGEFAVQEVINSSIYVTIPPLCKRKIGTIEQLFRENFAPNINNTFLVQECKKQTNCSIQKKLVEQLSNLTCESPVSCLGRTTSIADVMSADVISIGDVVNGSGCDYWFSSIAESSNNTKSGVSLIWGQLKLDWWLKEGCSNTTCSENADCTDVKLADGGFGHRCNCLEGFSGEAFTVPGGCRRLEKHPLRTGPWKLILILGVSSVLAFMIIIAVVVMVRANNMKKSYRNSENIEEIVMLKRYSYVQVKRMTKSFANVLGRGGFGTVYKGKLPDGGRDIAVKILKESNGNGEEFINEVASMSRTSHVNIVSLLGFCYEGSKKAIVYEFIPNGSLDKFISEKMPAKMEWKTLFNIAVGVSHGLEYLHNRCISRIVHFDIKPQNILIAENSCPKISDFGLAKLCKNNESIMSMLDARGTAGYIAPEVFSKNFGGVSHKSDVYSYGMVVLEMIGARNIERAQNAGSNNTSMYFPDWIYNDLEKGEIMSFLADQITEEEDEMIVKKMVLVGLWCIQTNPFDRPPMSKVVEMLEGSLEALQIPPKPLFCLPAVTIQNTADWIQETSSFSRPSQDNTSHNSEAAVQDSIRSS